MGKRERIALPWVTVVVEHILPVGGGLPDVFGEKLVLQFLRPVVVVRCMMQVQALRLLQEDDVGIKSWRRRSRSCAPSCGD